MPWEIDYALLTFTQLKKSSFYLPKEVEITIDSVLNLSSNIIDWKRSKIPKEYFIEKYNTYSLLLKDDYIHNKKIYQGDKLYGHLDLQKECIEKKINYYINICPDLYFSETLLASLIQLTNMAKTHILVDVFKKHPDNTHFVITAETAQMWDETWDEIVSPEFKHIPREDWYKTDAFHIRALRKQKIRESLIKNKNPMEYRIIVKNYIKWAGWFDLYSKDLYENIIIPPNDWKGYGPWDLFGINVVTNLLKNKNLKFYQFVINEKIAKYSTGPLNTIKGPNAGHWIQSPIKNFLHINKTKKEQREKMGKDGTPLTQLSPLIDSRIKKLTQSKII